MSLLRVNFGKFFGQARKCLICNRQGHIAAQCFKRECMACGELGHSPNECEENSVKDTQDDIQEIVRQNMGIIW